MAGVYEARAYEHPAPTLAEVVACVSSLLGAGDRSRWVEPGLHVNLAADRTVDLILV